MLKVSLTIMMLVFTLKIIFTFNLFMKYKVVTINEPLFQWMGKRFEWEDPEYENIIYQLVYSLRRF